MILSRGGVLQAVPLELAIARLVPAGEGLGALLVVIAGEGAQLDMHQGHGLTPFLLMEPAAPAAKHQRQGQGQQEERAADVHGS